METPEKPSKPSLILEKVGVLIGLVTCLWILYSIFIEGPSVANRKAPALPANIAELMQDSSFKAAGAPLYASTCSTCHGDDGGGGIGPNLTDDHWLEGDGSPQHILTAIAEGYSQKGMPSWLHKFDDEELLQLTVYVHSLKGTSPQKPKMPEGKKYP